MEQPPPSVRAPKAPQRPGWLALAEPLSVALLFVFLLWYSWLRWLDPFIDFPRSQYTAWRLAEGDLLYRQVTSWYGPLAHLLEALGFRLFGVGLDTLVWMNIGLTIVVLGLLRAIFGWVGNRLSVWLGSVVFLVVFAFGHFDVVANANFITPYASQATYGFFGLLLILWGLLRHLRSGRTGWMVLAGLGLAMAYLDKPEALLAGVGVVVVYFGARILSAAKQQPLVTNWGAAWRWARREGWRLTGGFFSLWLPVFLFFLGEGGMAYAWLSTNYVPYTILNPRFRDTLLKSPFMEKMFGFDHPWQNFRDEFLAGLLLVAICAALAWSAKKWARATEEDPKRWLWALMAVAIGFIGTGLCIWANHMGDMGTAFVFPVGVAAVVSVYLSLRASWLGQERAERRLGTAIIGVAAALMLARMVLYARLVQFGFFMMPLAVWWTMHVMVVEAARPGPGQVRDNWLLPAMFSLIVFSGVVVLALLSLSAYHLKTYPVAKGSDRFYALPKETYSAGYLVDVMRTAFPQFTPDAKTMVALPEGIEVNYLLRVPSSMPELEFHPVGLGYAGVDKVMDDLRAHPPEAVFLFHRDLSEYGVDYFGQDEKSGRQIIEWLTENYRVIWSFGISSKTYTGHAIDLLVPKSVGQPGLVLTPAPGH